MAAILKAAVKGNAHPKAPVTGAFLHFGAIVRLFLIFLVLISFAACAGDSAETVSVKYVLDGDTLTLESDEKVRLIGINAPENAHQDSPAQAYSLEATLALKELVEGKKVRLFRGIQKHDRYGRVLGYLESESGEDIQQLLLSRGYGYVVAFPPDIARLEQYIEAENTARNARLGVWEQLTLSNLDRSEKHLSGFGIFQGRVAAVRQSSRSVHFSFGGNVIVTVSTDRWSEFWTARPESFVGKKVETRGWLTRASGKDNKNAFYLKVRHPSMLRVVNN